MELSSETVSEEGSYLISGQILHHACSYTELPVGGAVCLPNPVKKGVSKHKNMLNITEKEVLLFSMPHY